MHVVDDGCHGEYGMRDGWNEEPCNCTVIYSLSPCDFPRCVTSSAVNASFHFAAGRI